MWRWISLDLTAVGEGRVLPIKYANSRANAVSAGRIVAPGELPAVESAIMKQCSGMLVANGCHGSVAPSVELFAQRAVMTLTGLPSMKARILATMSG
jgi:hypothetical protein